MPTPKRPCIILRTMWRVAQAMMTRVMIRTLLLAAILFVPLPLTFIAMHLQPATRPAATRTRRRLQ